MFNYQQKLSDERLKHIPGSYIEMAAKINAPIAMKNCKRPDCYAWANASGYCRKHHKELSDESRS